MKTMFKVLLAGAAMLALSACGSSDSADEKASEENVEMPAEEAVADVEATPVAQGAAAPVDDASASASASPAPSSEASAAVEAATAKAEKTM